MAMNENGKIAYNLNEAAEALQISRPTMQTLVHRADFPSFKVGTRWIIPADAFRRWLNEQVELAREEKVG
ncbi:MAG: helix-turn-helix domain-containing protein [Clostridia bacterium]|nr:helix-turn-helix domain-containing protein [Clostridia bacterium]